MWKTGVTRKFLTSLIVFLLVFTPVANAEVVNYDYSVDAYTEFPNDTASSSVYITADTQHRPGYKLSDVYISWEIKAGDKVEVWFWDGQAEELQAFSITPSNTSVRNYKVTPPAGAATGQIVLKSGSATGNRYAWINKFDNTYGDTAIFLDPTIEDDPDDPGDPGDPDDPGDPSTGTDLTEVIAGINEVKGAINGMSSGVITELQGVRNQISNLTSDMNQQFDAVKSRLDVISDDVADIKDDVSVIRSDVTTMKNYLITPRSPSPLQMNALPQPSMDSSVPDLSEPYQTPYTYDRDETTFPPAEFGPEPLPFAPDPEVMPHDEPLMTDAPTILNEPLPRENPRSMDPVTKEDPRQMDPVNMDLPNAVDTPIPRKNPLGRDNPLTPQTPLTPTPPIAPGG